TISDITYESVIKGYNAGGLISGGDNSTLYPSITSENIAFTYGAGAIANSCLAGIVTVNISKINGKFSLYGENSGGLIAGGSSIFHVNSQGAGCIGNGSVYDRELSLVTFSITHCNMNGTLRGNNSGVLLAGGAINNLYNGGTSGGGCIANGSRNTTTT